MKNITCLYFFAVLIFVSGPSVSGAGRYSPSQSIRPVVHYYKGTSIVRTLGLDFKNNSKVSDASGSDWILNVEETPVTGQSDARDYQLTWTLSGGQVKEAAVGVNFPFDDWSVNNFVLVPSAVYNGNRFEVKNASYPPYWYNRDEWRLDMPTTTTVLPSLSKYENYSKIEMTTGSASTPLMAFYAPEKKMGWIVLTTQGNQLGDHGMFIEEDKSLSKAVFSITSPAVRIKRTIIGSGFTNSGDKAAEWNTGDKASIRFRVYTFPVSSIQGLYKRFLEVRKDLNKATRREELPFSATWNIMNDLLQQDRWDSSINMYCLSKPGTGSTWNYIWQLGWCGGGQVTLPLFMQGTGNVRERVLKNLDVVFSRSQAPSGLFNAYGNGTQFASFGFGSAFKNNETFIRSQGDWLYMAQRQFREIEAAGESIPAHWASGLKKQADRFVSIWKKYRQFGQFADVITGDICIGGSTAGAIVPGGLALASQTYRNQEFLRVAQASCRKYYQDYVLKGYTTGGPGEILSAPDSESAFALFESFMTLYEVTGSKEWLRYASDLLPICASWTVSYDFRFPENSAMGKIGARSCGAVWASVANKHGAPGICTWSGDSFLKYYRATGDERAAELIADIAHGFPQYISRADRPVGKMPPGGVCERVNLSDWEGKNNIGGNIFASCSWVETAALLTVTQLPGLYVQPDKRHFIVFDNIAVTPLSSGKEPLRLRLHNPTQFPAEVKVYTESSKEARKVQFAIQSDKTKLVYLNPGASKELSF
ncbi:glycoside hydrolase family protein [Niabella drilacis]|uniref:Uncharacterized protein n=1 Tax=Niabella drilacis (strain DSM 25811 / CCM 8410 / CCUG 62505 / LMG 26954 / E90) TaxID=1285928 RepID=A0A1G7A722_NIADE|nr:hypothetical protein [Niabella drilacis]SDE10612.1 hypothetical protein SAMN04487894_12138 [Niabella drilacis]